MALVGDFGRTLRMSGGTLTTSQTCSITYRCGILSHMSPASSYFFIANALSGSSMAVFSARSPVGAARYSLFQLLTASLRHSRHSRGLCDDEVRPLCHQQGQVPSVFYKGELFCGIGMDGPSKWTTNIHFSGLLRERD